MDKLNKKLLASPNLQQERIDQLKELMPDLFTNEGNLDVVALKELVGSDYLAKENYNFSWYGKADARQKAFSPSYATLRKDEKRSVHPQDGKGNMIIEGENLEVLKVLLHSYRESIKCIYIDPPYNTNSDFVYKDSWASNSQEYLEAVGATADGIKLTSSSNSDGRKHSNWLSMIYARLLVARQLLKDDGVIFVSIDDNEQANLKKVMDEVFGEENFVGNIAWESKTKSQNTNTAYDKLQPKIEHIFVYTKAKKRRFNLVVKGEKEYPLIDEQGVYREYILEVMNASGVRGRETMIFSIEGISPPPGKQWKLGQAQIADYQKSGDLFIKKGKVVIKIRPSGEKMDLTEPFWAFFSKEIGTAESAKKEVTQIFSINNIFDTVKPIKLIERLIFHVTEKDDIILDFFAGSGTTAHAVMDLNAKDGGNRKFILVQLKEQIDEDKEAYKAGYKFISDITIARNQKAIEKNLYNTGFTVYSLAQSHFPRVEFELDNQASQEQNLARLEAYIAEKENAIVLGSMVSNEHALLDEVLLKQGFKLDYTLEKQACTTNTIYKVEDGSQSAYVSVDKVLNPESFSYLSTLHDSLFICLGMALTTSQRHELNQILGKNLIIV